MKKISELFNRWKRAGMFALGLGSALATWHNPIEVHHIRNGEVIGVYQTTNGIVDVGVNSLLDVTFRNQTQIASWYMGLVDNSGFTAYANSDTMSSHSGWGELTAYSEATRPQWSPAAASARAVSNSTPIDFTINGSGTVKGVFITSNNTKSGTTGTLWATASFASTVPVINGDVLKVTYTVSG